MNAKGEDGATALILASCNGHDKVVKALLNHVQVDVNAAKSNGATALIGACCNGTIDENEEVANANVAMALHDTIPSAM